MFDTSGLGVAETVRLTASGEASAVEVAEAALDRMERLNGPLNAISVTLADEALAEATALDKALAEGAMPAPLHGVPIVIKEEMVVAGTVSTFGTLGNSTPALADCEVVRRLRAAGAVIVGKAHMPEFGAWPYTETTGYGITRNPWDLAHTPGGSSGGTAAAVSSGMVPVGMGGDGGGSIRIPSACCGLFGLKPQRGRVTTAPDPHLWWALGTVGPLTRSVLDSALVYDVIRGNTATDRFTAPDSGSFVGAAGREPGRLRIGWSTKPAAIGVRPDPIHVRAVQDTAQLLADLGHEVFEVDPNYPEATLPFLAQVFGGIRSEADAMEHYDRLERRTRQMYRMGAWVRPGVREWAIRSSEKVSVKANRVFERCDVLLTPTIGHRPARAGILDGTGAVRALLRSMPAAVYTAIWNVAGNPAASVPCGIASDGLPTAVQLVGRTNDEATLLSLAAQIEAARPWPLLAP